MSFVWIMLRRGFLSLAVAFWCVLVHQREWFLFNAVAAIWFAIVMRFEDER